MSGSIGANRIPSSAVKKTVDSFIEKVLKKYPGFKSAKITGSYNIIPKDENGEVVGGQEKPEGHGDIDLVVELEGTRENMKKVKADFAAYLNSLSDDVTVPFRAGRHTGKKTAGTGDIVITQYHIEGFPDLTVQIDNMIVSSEEESTYRASFLDIPGPKQALMIGLAKAMCNEEDPFEIFKRLGIKNIPALAPEKNLGQDKQLRQEYEFTLSSKGLTLRVVTLEVTKPEDIDGEKQPESFKEISREDVWTSHNWSDVEELFKDYNINGKFEDLLKQLASKQWKSSRSKSRIKGTFNSMLVIGAGEEGTPKGEDKEEARKAVAALEGKYSKLTMELVRPLLLEQDEETSQKIAVFPGAFKPPHKSHFDAVNIVANTPGIDIVKLYVSTLARGEQEGEITSEQALAIWNIYKKYLSENAKIEIIPSNTPVRDAYKEVEDHPANAYLAVYGKGEEGRWKAVDNNREKYGHVDLFSLGDIEGVSATQVRAAIQQYKKGQTKEEKKKSLKQIINNLPKGLSSEDTLRVLRILLN
jgi:hypothetical protein